MINFRENEDFQLDFNDVLLVPNVNKSKLASRSEVNLTHPDYHCTPIIVANMDSIGTFEMATHLKPFKIMIAMLKDYSVEEWQKEVASRELDTSCLIPTMGTKDLDIEIERVGKLVELFPNIPFVCIDVANGYLIGLSEAVRKIKEALPHVKVCAGNVVDEIGVELLAKAGADIVKIGIGSGGVCLTRQKTGVGYPQFSAVNNVIKTASKLNVQIVSDGGVTCPGDVAKAFAAGADFVMMGSYFAGHEETGTIFHGMSSDKSRTNRGQDILDYRATEGREVILKSKGSIAHTMRDLLGGVRSACTYLGVVSLHELKNANIRAIKVNRQLNRISGVEVES